MDTENNKKSELWISQSLLLSKICGIDISQSSRRGSPSNPDCKNPFNTLFFSSQDNNELTLSLPVRTLLKNCPNFDTHNIDNNSLNPIELQEIEKFRECFLALLNQGHGTVISDKIAFLNVAFLHFNGNSAKGYITRDEVRRISSTYQGIFANNSYLEASIYKILDRENRGSISLLDFICGFIACSPEINDSLKTFEGKLRLQHIFTAYDIDKDGHLDKTELKLLISDIYKHGNFDNSQQSIEQDVETLSSRFDTFTYDVFYKCVEIEAIQHTEILFRIAFDLAEKVKEHLVYALANIQTLSTANPTREPLWSKVVEKMSTSNNITLTQYQNPIADFKYTDIPNSTDRSFDEKGFDEKDSTRDAGFDVKAFNVKAFNVKAFNVKAFNEKILTRDAGFNERQIGGAYGLRAGVFSDRSGLSSERSDGVDVYSQLNRIYSPPQSDCRNFPYQITRIKTFKPIEPRVIYDNTQIKKDVQATKSDAKADELEKQKNEKVSLELEYRINTLIKDYFKRYIAHNSENAVDKNIASSVFTQMYTTFFGLERNQVESQIAPFRWCNYHNLLMLCNNFYHILSRQDKIVKVKSPAHVIGDLATNFMDLIQSFNMYGWPLHSRTSEDSTVLTHLIINICGRISPQNTPTHPLEYLLLVMSLKVLFPKHVTIIGHYEKSNISIDAYNCHLYNDILDNLTRYQDNFNLLNDSALISQCAKELLNKIINIFDVMPKGALIDQSVLIRGVPVEYDGVFDKYFSKKNIPRLTIVPSHSEESSNLASLCENLNLDNSDSNSVRIINGSKYGLPSASLFISGDRIVYNPLNQV